MILVERGTTGSVEGTGSSPEFTASGAGRSSDWRALVRCFVTVCLLVSRM
jgi:hypothetical protein